MCFIALTLRLLGLVLALYVQMYAYSSVRIHLMFELYAYPVRAVSNHLHVVAVCVCVVPVICSGSSKVTHTAPVDF